MSVISFANEMLGEDLKEIGFQRKKGTEWFKIIGGCIYLNVFVREVHGFLDIYCKARALFSPLLDTYGWMHNVNLIYREIERSKGSDGCALHYEEDDADYSQKMILTGREMFSCVKPVLAEVKDIETCYEANEKLGWLEVFHGKGVLFGHPYLREEHTSVPPEDGFFMLCAMDRLEEGADYLKRAISNYKRDLSYRALSDSFKEQLVKEEKSRYEHYIQMIEAHDYNGIKEIMLKNYNEACEKLEIKYRIKINIVNI